MESETAAFDRFSMILLVSLMLRQMGNAII